MKLANSVAVITGAASGLGAGAARRLAEAGANVVVVDLPGTAAKDVAKEIGNNSIAVECDVTNSAAVEECVTAARNEYGKIDICVNAAGVPHSARILSRDRDLFPLDVFRDVIEVNLIGLFDMMRMCARAMSYNEPNYDGERGVIVNVSSVASTDGVAGHAAYSASKGGVASLTLPAARDLARWGIRVVTVCPGLFDTGMFAGLPEKIRERYLKLPVFPKRAGCSSEFGMLVEAIVSNPILNGESIRLDAGARPGHNE